VPCSAFFSDAFETFTHQEGNRLSFADAAIAYVARERAGGLVLTFDKEFDRFPGVQVAAESEP
jgi:predicted nucleic acid-binding protein